MHNYQTLLYDPVYEEFGQLASLTLRGSNSAISVTVNNRTKPSSFAGFNGVEFQAFKPTALVRMAEIGTLGVTAEQIQGGHLIMDGTRWAVKSYEYEPSPVGISDGQLRLFLHSDAETARGSIRFSGIGRLIADGTVTT